MDRVVLGVGGAVIAAVVLAVVWMPPVDSDDVAGWVQAIGSITAVGLAVWLQYEARNERIQQAERLAGTFAREVVRCFDELEGAARTQQGDKYSEARALLETWSTMEIPIAELPMSTIQAVVTIKRLAVTTLVSAPTGPEQMGWDHWKSRFASVGLKARDAMLSAYMSPPDKVKSGASL